MSVALSAGRPSAAIALRNSGLANLDAIPMLSAMSQNRTWPAQCARLCEAEAHRAHSGFPPNNREPAHQLFHAWQQ